MVDPKFDTVNPEIAVSVTPLTLPCKSVVKTGIVVEFPYVEATPTLGSDNDTVPPKLTKPPPLKPVPAPTVREEFKREELPIFDNVFVAPEIDLLVKISLDEEIMYPESFVH